MKLRIFTLVLALVLLVSAFAGCQKTPVPEEQPLDNTPAPEKTLEVSLDLTKEWKALNGSDSLVQGCLVVRRAFLEEHFGAVQAFLAAYKESVEFLNANPKEAAALISETGIFENATIAEKAIPKCNICYLDGAEMKTAMEAYLTALASVNPNAIGGKLPEDDFYYVSEAAAEENDTTIKVFTLNGTTGFGMAKLIAEDTVNEYTVKTDASDVTAALVSGDADIAALPTNAASALYNKTGGKVVILAVNTKGCLYLLNSTGEKIESLADLKGKTVYVPAQNPTFIVTYLLGAAGLTVGKDVFLDSESYAVPANLRDAVASGEVELAVLPEPMVTIAKAKFGK